MYAQLAYMSSGMVIKKAKALLDSAGAFPNMGKPLLWCDTLLGLDAFIANQFNASIFRATLLGRIRRYRTGK